MNFLANEKFGTSEIRTVVECFDSNGILTCTLSNVSGILFWLSGDLARSRVITMGINGSAK